MSRTAAKKPAAAPAVPLYKVLVDGHSHIAGKLDWSLPTADGPGEWHEVEGPLVQCRNGLHLTPDPSNYWRDDAEVYLVEAEEVMGDPRTDTEVVARRVRLMRRLTWADLAAFGITVKGIDHTHKAQVTTAKRRFPLTPPAPKKGPSPAMRLMEGVWENRCGANEHSWRRVNNSMQQALSLAVHAGLSFAEGDFKTIYSSMRGGYWMGDSEGYYSLAVEERHTQACLSYEAWRGRKPFMWEGKRLHRGARLEWQGLLVAVTSFDDEAGALVACSYKPMEDADDHSVRIDKRFTITLAELKQAERDRKVELQVRAAATNTQKLLNECQVFVDFQAIFDWTPEQRTEADEWAITSRVDAYKKRVKPPLAPAHVLAGAAPAKALKQAKKKVDTLRHAENAVKDAESRVRYSASELERANERLVRARAASTEQAAA